MSNYSGYFVANLPKQDVRFVPCNEAIPSTVVLDVTDGGTEKVAIGTPFFLGVGVIRELAVPLLGAGSCQSGPAGSGMGNYAY